jgi:hypothetical protein
VTAGITEMHTPLPILLVASAAAVLIVRTVVSYCSTARRARLDWKDMVLTLQPLDVESLDSVARDYLAPEANQLKLQPDEIWALAGGWIGVRRMRRNAEVMLALAAYTQRWNFDEGVVVTERMRRDALRLRRALWRLELNRVPLLMRFLPRTWRWNAPFEVHEVASCYYLMRRRLLALYETSHAGLYPVLARAL